jgi:energy coupling factor transporter S component ThiW
MKIIELFQCFYKANQIESEASSTSTTKRVALGAVLTALTVSLSTFYIPLGTTKCFPAQHMVNGIAGVLLGPWYAAVMAVATGTVRNILGLGTLYAFPGGIPGALVVGFVHRYLLRNDIAALSEPIGTVAVGATLSALVLAPLQGHSLTMYFFWAAFAASSIPGAFLGYVVLKGLRRLGLERMLL